VAETVGPVAPRLEQYTGEVLFRDLWLRPALASRDRSLVTVSALISLGHVGQIPYHLNRAMDSGLTQAEASEVLTHLAFYAGWPNASSAVPVAKGVFDKRPPWADSVRSFAYLRQPHCRTRRPVPPRARTVSSSSCSPPIWR
jgi:4-carboxymuconolactone decarboxylase